MNKDFLLLQINDALFPIGSYTHSFGLETYIQKNLVHNKTTALDYIKSNLNTQFLYTELLSLKLSFEYAKNNDLKEILKLEEYICLSSSPMELRNANQKLGTRFLKTIQTLSLEADHFFKQYLQNTLNPTHSTAYGVFCACLDLNFKKSLEHYLYAQTSNNVTNCVKTIPLSQNDGQKILFELQDVFEEVLLKLENLDRSYLCACSIHNDIKAMQHQNLYSRLYMS